ncbi:STN domain-containing protein [Pseudomonas sp. MM211]|uniref:STN domain-containing protein n=1 Tax=Pseudomonas sp. MM211 TaxID=2866808 RepID=UPI001CED7AEC|nr:STN domain-containing protein [Pseudomonas sp. MM211]
MFRPWPLAVAIAFAGLPYTVVMADPAAQQQTLQFNLPAASLANTLNAIARQSGRVISLNPALVSGKQAPAVHGELSAEQALHQALAGSGLQLVVTGSGSFSVMPEVSASGALELSSLSISGKAPGSITEGTGPTPPARRAVPRDSTCRCRKRLNQSPY